MTHNKDNKLRLLIEKGLKRSALKAREKALQTNTPLVVEVDGELKEIKVTTQDVQNFREEIKEAL
jgi:ribosomal protein L25 (general stress protein Ctc)